MGTIILLCNHLTCAIKSEEVAWGSVSVNLWFFKDIRGCEYVINRVRGTRDANMFTMRMTSRTSVLLRSLESDTAITRYKNSKSEERRELKHHPATDLRPTFLERAAGVGRWGWRGWRWGWRWGRGGGLG